MKKRVWIDTDPAVTHCNREVDDAYALIRALRSPELEIVGISAVFGNADVDHGFAMAQEIVARSGRNDVPVFKGCAGAGDRKDNPAILGLREALEEEPLAIAALGPLTTVAAALDHPDARLDHVEDIVFVGGRRKGLAFLVVPGQPRPFPDMNFESDVAATETLLNLGCKMTLAGWEVSNQFWVTPAHLDLLLAKGDACAGWLAEQSRPWQSRWMKELGTTGFTPFDALAIGWLLRPQDFQSLHWPTEITGTGKEGLFVADPSLSGPSVTYLQSVDVITHREDLMARLMGQPILANGQGA